jgi:hypothetical protein
MSGRGQVSRPLHSPSILLGNMKVARMKKRKEGGYLEGLACEVVSSQSMF